MTDYELDNDDEIPEPPFELASSIAKRQGANLSIEPGVPLAKVRKFLEVMTMLLSQVDVVSNVSALEEPAPPVVVQTDDAAESVNTVKTQLKQALEHGCYGENELTEWLKLLDSIEWQVVCSLCGELCPQDMAHLHQDKWICDENCWDDRLKASE